jgi:hypothetical protein
VTPSFSADLGEGVIGISGLNHVTRALEAKQFLHLLVGFAHDGRAAFARALSPIAFQQDRRRELDGRHEAIGLGLDERVWVLWHVQKPQVAKNVERVMRREQHAQSRSCVPDAVRDRRRLGVRPALELRVLGMVRIDRGEEMSPVALDRQRSDSEALHVIAQRPPLGGLLASLVASLPHGSQLRRRWVTRAPRSAGFEPLDPSRRQSVSAQRGY